METLDERREQLCMNFALKCLKNPRFKDMFPLNERCNDMHTRNPEKYKVQFALTDRLQNSPITYMQRLLNENNQNEENRLS